MGRGIRRDDVLNNASPSHAGAAVHRHVDDETGPRPRTAPSGDVPVGADRDADASRHGVFGVAGIDHDSIGQLRQHPLQYPRGLVEIQMLDRLVENNQRSIVEQRAASHLCLHDAAILSDTVRENLFAPGASEQECWLALAAVELDGRLAGAGGLDAWISQDMLSLGEAQRLNLARALLCDAPVVLLDEPVEHLDHDQASRILKRVLSQLVNRIVVYSSHTDYAAPETINLIH